MLYLPFPILFSYMKIPKGKRDEHMVRPNDEKYP